MPRVAHTQVGGGASPRNVKRFQWCLQSCMPPYQENAGDLVEMGNAVTSRHPHLLSHTHPLSWQCSISSVSNARQLSDSSKVAGDPLPPWAAGLDRRYADTRAAHYTRKNRYTATFLEKFQNKWCILGPFWNDGFERNKHHTTSHPHPTTGG